MHDRMDSMHIWFSHPFPGRLWRLDTNLDLQSTSPCPQKQKTTRQHWYLLLPLPPGGNKAQSQRGSTDLKQFRAGREEDDKCARRVWGENEKSIRRAPYPCGVTGQAIFCFQLQVDDFTCWWSGRPANSRVQIPPATKPLRIR